MKQSARLAAQLPSFRKFEPKSLSNSGFLLKRAFIGYVSVSLHLRKESTRARSRHANLTSHQALDKDEALQQEACNVAQSLAQSIAEQRAGRQLPDANLKDPRPK